MVPSPTGQWPVCLIFLICKLRECKRITTIVMFCSNRLILSIASYTNTHWAPRAWYITCEWVVSTILLLKTDVWALPHYLFLTKDFLFYFSFIVFSLLSIFLLFIPHDFLLSYVSAEQKELVCWWCWLSVPSDGKLSSLTCKFPHEGSRASCSVATIDCRPETVPRGGFPPPHTL